MKKMTGSEIREEFLKFFEGKGHKRLASASLIPANDPSILWTAAGMVPFKPYFTGAAVPEIRRITTCQKSLRTPDIEVVGRTARHHTFFEMLGNFSFGDYFKREAINWAWEFITVNLEVPKEVLWITIYKDDDEAFEIWNKEIGIEADRIVRMDKDTNFWEIGVGPCGPCSEIYVDLGESKGCNSPDCAVGCDCDRYLEIWNLVFIQFFKDEAGVYTPLESPGIDTGMGLERIASVLQGVPTNFDTDIFREIMDFTANELGVQYGDKKVDLGLKVIADHCRAVTFAVADGAFPSNEGRGYVLRRLIRRAVRFGRLMGITDIFMHKVSGAIMKQMGDVYPELKKYKETVFKVLKMEEERFGQTLSQGTEILNKLVEEYQAKGQKQIDGASAFKLYDTYGFPLELTKEMLEEKGMDVDEDGFKNAMEEQRQRARDARQETEYISEMGSKYKDFRDENGETVFVGYDKLESKGKVLAIFKEGEQVDRAVAGEEALFILDTTPCYAESGGQIYDLAVITNNEDLNVSVTEVFKPVDGLFVHKAWINKGTLWENGEVDVAVDVERRQAIARNHSATHLLHKALKEVLGEHVNQAGSSVDFQRLRFDFTHMSPISEEEMLRIEDIVNQKVLENLAINTTICSLSEAQEKGATALFGEKYGQEVRMVSMGDFSIELCGGTHLKNTAEVGLCKVLGESSIGSGLRRIEAVTGKGALDYIRSKDEQLEDIAVTIKASSADVLHRLETMLKDYKELEKESETLKSKLARLEVEGMLNNVVKIDDVNLLAAKSSVKDMDSLRNMLDLLRQSIESGVIVLAASSEDKVNLVASVTKDLVPMGLHAGKMIKEIASIVGGSGGGKPEMAQAGGKDVSRIQEALDKAKAIIKAQIK